MKLTLLENFLCCVSASVTVAFIGIHIIESDPTSVFIGTSLGCIFGFMINHLALGRKDNEN